MSAIKRFFGKSKKQDTNNESPMGSLEKHSEQLAVLEKREKLLLKKIAAERENAKKFLKVENKRAAIQCIKKKKMYEEQIEQTSNLQLRIHHQMIMLEGAKVTTETVDALRKGAKTMKSMEKQMSINDVDKTMDEIHDQTENLKQVQEALAKPCDEFDEDELEAELVELETAELEKELPRPVPRTHVTPAPSKPRLVPQKQTREVDELAALQAEMAL